MKKLATLYELTAQAQKLYGLMEEGEIDQITLNDTLESMGANKKLENYIYIVKQLENDRLVLTTEKDRLDKKIKACNKNIEKMKNAIVSFMESSGLSKTRAGTFSLSVGTTEKITITDEEKIPKNFFVKQPKKIDLVALKKEIKKGTKIEGAILEKGKYLIAR